MRTEATPDLLCTNDYGSYSRKPQEAVLFRLLSFVPKLCPKDIRDIETYLKISNSIEIQNPRKTACVQRNYLIICTLRLFSTSYTRVKSEVEDYCRPPSFSITYAILGITYITRSVTR